MAEIKRKFYNTGDAKGFTKAVFYQAVMDMVDGNEVAEDILALVKAACEYEIEGINTRASSKATGERKDPLESDYAKALSAAIVPLIGGTPKTAKELIEAADAKGLKSPKGTSFAAPWVSRVLNATPGVVAVKKVVEKVDAKGLKSQAEVTAYKKG